MTTAAPPPATTVRTEGSESPALPTTMRALVRHRYGAPSSLRVETVPVPEIGPREVLVEVAAAGLDVGTWHLVTGLPYLMRLAGFGMRAPHQPIVGFDVAGRIVAVGGEVTRFAAGDEVFGIADGSFAAYARAEESKLVHKPAAVGFDQAAVSGVSGISALQACTTVASIRPDDHVLVLGASGAVGSFAAQVARSLGARVTGTASTAKVDLVRGLGVDHVIDHSVTGLDDLADRYDVIVDTGGRNPLRSLRRRLTPDGTLVIVGGEGGNRLTGGIGRQLRAAAISPFISPRLTFFISEESVRYLEPMAAMLGDGRVRPVIGQTVPLDGVADALEAMTQGRLVGKTLVRVTDT